ncbi:C40 family peptidase [Roseburia sp. 499]|uniref:C40 family peptidase n=1 Tax=Roseburia sp. 499 TaxID=1261634 RepID=UPI0009512981|nr:SH3 domain-containing protein [Roseburia sp. 499]WVK70350.1 SH3 domain-containing protein [Roseburia sp. 499]
MNRNRIRVAACCLTATVVLSSSSFVSNAAPTAGAGNFVSTALATETTNDNSTETSASANAGVSQTFSQYLTQKPTATTVESAIQVVQNETPVVKSEYDDIAIAQVDNYVNVRSTASEDGEVVGKLYNNSAATVLATEGDWYQIHSGNVEGYIKAEFLVVGDAELSKSVGTRVAKVNTQTLNVRKEATTEAGILGQVPNGEELTVVEEIDGWTKVSIEEGDGWVSNEFVETSTHYTTAESKEEEEARLKKEEEERQAAAEAARRASEKSGSSSGNSSSGSSRTYNPPSGGSGQAVADYACQFIGNPYVYGGTSLTNGADCSGFVMSVYAAFGIGLPHSSSGMRSVGYEVSQDAMQPGDIVCYSGHVGIYVGNGTIVNASTEATGIKYTNAYYRNIITVRRIF